MNIRELDKSLIDAADFHSAVGMGGIISRTYQRNLSTIEHLSITEQEKQKFIDRLHELTTEELTAYKTLYPCISVVGPARYNVKKGNRAADIQAGKAQAIQDFMNSLVKEEQRKKNEQKNTEQTKSFVEAVQNKKKWFEFDGIVYIVIGRTRFVEKKYAGEERIKKAGL